MGKVSKLFTRIDQLIVFLGKERHNLKVNLYVDQFYYMQKMVELQVLAEQANEAQQRLEAEYARVFCQWKKDARLVNRVGMGGATKSIDFKANASHVVVDAYNNASKPPTKE